MAPGVCDSSHKLPSIALLFARQINGWFPLQEIQENNQLPLGLASHSLRGEVRHQHCKTRGHSLSTLNKLPIYISSAISNSDYLRIFYFFSNNVLIPFHASPLHTPHPPFFFRLVLVKNKLLGTLKLKVR